MKKIAMAWMLVCLFAATTRAEEEKQDPDRELMEARERAEKNPKDPQARFDYANLLLKHGKQESALREFLWCWDYGVKYDESFQSQRRVFLLKNIKHIAQSLPEAREALEERRVAAGKLIERGDCPEDVILDFVELNYIVGKPEHALAVYDKLKQNKTDAKTVKRMFREISGLLISAKRYRDYLAETGDVMDAWKNAPKDAEIIEDTLRLFGECFGALLGAGEKDKAATLAEALLLRDSGVDTYALLVENALTVGDRDAAKQWVEHGLKTLSDANDIQRLQALGESIPRE